MTKLKQVEKAAAKFDHNVLEVAKELKRLQSIKCRLKKQKGKKTYEQEMTEILQNEQLLKEVRQFLDPKEKPVTQYEQADIDQLDYDQVVKALRSIQSKKTLSKWLTEIEKDNDEYRNAERIEKMLIEKRNQIKPVDNDHIRKTELQTIIDTIESSGKVSQEKILEMLKSLV